MTFLAPLSLFLTLELARSLQLELLRQGIKSLTVEVHQVIDEEMAHNVRKENWRVLRYRKTAVAG